MKESRGAFQAITQIPPRNKFITFEYKTRLLKIERSIIHNFQTSKNSKSKVQFAIEIMRNGMESSKVEY